MTKDEAIKIIQTEMECVQRADCDRLACAYCDLAMRDEDVLTAYQMAITALQTDGYTISRQGAIDTLDKHLRTTDVPVSYPGIISALTEWLNELPSVQPEEVIPHRNYKYLSDYWCECGWHLGKRGDVKYCSECGKKVNWDD